MTYIIFAKWFGVVSVLLSLGILFNQEEAKAMAKNMVNQETGYIMGGVLPIIFGSYSLVQSNAYSLSWQLCVTFVSLMMVIIGVYRVFFVNHWRALMHKNLDKIPPMFSLFGLILGLLLLYVGFVAEIVRYDIALLMP